MKKHALIPTALVVALFAATSAFAGVTISSPSNGSTVGTSVHFAATASTSCAKGVAAMGIYPSANWLVYTVSGSNLSTNINLNPGTYNAVLVAWDNCGGASTAGTKVTVQANAGVHVTSPSNNGTVGSPVSFVATATTTCPKGVASMGIYTAPSQLAYSVGGASLNTSLSLSPGTYHTTLEEWDYCGGAATAPVTITVGSSGKTLSNIQSNGGWRAYAQQPPNYGDCTWCTPSGPQTTWAMYQGIRNPTLSGSGAQYNLGGTQAYTDVLWNNHLIGDLSSWGMPDSGHTVVPTLHSYTYDVYFYGSNLGASQALEFDVNQFFGGMGFTWGHECRLAGGYEWDIWDNTNARWVSTGIACNPVNNSWNHLVIQVQRTSDNQLLYQSITLNGQTHVLNRTYSHFSAPGWYGITVNVQLDGNNKQTPYSVYVDKLNFTYQ